MGVRIGKAERNKKSGEQSFHHHHKKNAGIRSTMKRMEIAYPLAWDRKRFDCWEMRKRKIEREKSDLRLSQDTGALPLSCHHHNYSHILDSKLCFFFFSFFFLFYFFFLMGRHTKNLGFWNNFFLFYFFVFDFQCTQFQNVAWTNIQVNTF